jgi:hypothetical protein
MLWFLKELLIAGRLIFALAYEKLLHQYVQFCPHGGTGNR